MFEFGLSYSDGVYLTFECSEEEILELAERFSDDCSYIIYKIKRIKEFYKEKKK